MSLVIRHASDDEMDVVASLIVDAYAEFAATMSPDAWSMFAQDIANVQGRRTNGEIIVAERDNRLVGSLTLFRDWRGAQEGTMAVRLLAVLPDERHGGVGSGLLQWAVDEARRGGKKKIIMAAMQSMDSVRELVDKMGFERSQELDHEPAPGVRSEGYSLSL